MNIKMIIIPIVLGGLLSACAPQPAMPVELNTVNADGLQKVKSTYFSAALVRPGIDLSDYQQLLLSDSELAFKTPDRAKQQFPLAEEQKDKFRQLLDRQFEAALGSSDSLQLTDSAGPKVLKLQVRVQDIIATVPPRSVSSVSSIALYAVGEATLVIELSDSESAEVLARVYDRRAIEGTAISQKQGAPITQWEEVEALCKHWASTVRARLDVVMGGNY
jgi:hypothetical protein